MKICCVYFITFKTFEGLVEPRWHFATPKGKGFAMITRNFFDNINLLQFMKIMIFFSMKITNFVFLLAMNK